MSWELFYHFLTVVARLSVVDVEKEKDIRWKVELDLLNKGIQDARLSDVSLSFASWYRTESRHGERK